MTLLCGWHLAPDLKIMLFYNMLKKYNPATLALDMSCSFCEIVNFVFFLDSFGSRHASDMFLHGLLKINIWLNWFWQWPYQNPNCPNDIDLWDTSGTSHQNHAVSKNAKKSASSNIGLRHELSNFQNWPLGCFLWQLWTQTCKWHVFARPAKNQCVTQLALAMTIPTPKLTKWFCSIGHIWHQTPKSLSFFKMQKIIIQQHWPSTWAEQFPKLFTLLFFGTALVPDLQMICVCMACWKVMFDLTGSGNDHTKTQTVPMTLIHGTHLAPDIKIILFL